jgi:hypothetical protein
MYRISDLGLSLSELPLLVFDVNETLLDIEALAPQLQRIYGDAGVLREWFAQLILYSEAITLTGNYVPFGELAGANQQPPVYLQEAARPCGT